MVNVIAGNSASWGNITDKCEALRSAWLLPLGSADTDNDCRGGFLYLNGPRENAVCAGCEQIDAVALCVDLDQLPRQEGAAETAGCSDGQTHTRGRCWRRRTELCCWRSGWHTLRRRAPGQAAAESESDHDEAGQAGIPHCAHLITLGGRPRKPGFASERRHGQRFLVCRVEVLANHVCILPEGNGVCA